jgi:RNA polymerase sigma-70 factor (ECF subfamily)
LPGRAVYARIPLVTRPESTRWTVIRDAADGDAAAREEFARRYEVVIRAYLGARWRHSPLLREMDDAVQEVFLACFEEGGALARVEPDRPGGFRGFLYGVTRNMARRMEAKRVRDEKQPSGRVEMDEVEAREEPLSRVFDRAWANSLILQAVRLHAERARERDGAALRRVELLRLRFGEDLPIREIARQWEADPAWLHHEYAKARTEFADALREVVREHHEGSTRDVEAECSRLAQYLRH